MSEETKAPERETFQMPDDQRETMSEATKAPESGTMYWAPFPLGGVIIRAHGGESNGRR